MNDDPNKKHLKNIKIPVKSKKEKYPLNSRLCCCFSTRVHITYEQRVYSRTGHRLPDQLMISFYDSCLLVIVVSVLGMTHVYTTPS